MALPLARIIGEILWDIKLDLIQLALKWIDSDSPRISTFVDWNGKNFEAVIGDLAVIWGQYTN